MKLFCRSCVLIQSSSLRSWCQLQDAPMPALCAVFQINALGSDVGDNFNINFCVSCRSVSNGNTFTWHFYSLLLVENCALGDGKKGAWADWHKSIDWLSKNTRTGDFQRYKLADFTSANKSQNPLRTQSWINSSAYSLTAARAPLSEVPKFM